LYRSCSGIIFPDERPEFISPAYIEANVGDSIVITCNGTKHEPRWTHNNDTYLPYNILERRNSLIINHTYLNNSGTYTCLGLLEFGTQTLYEFFANKDYFLSTVTLVVYGK